MPLPLGSEPSRCPTHHSYSIAFDALPLRLTAFASFLSPSVADQCLSIAYRATPRLCFAYLSYAVPLLFRANPLLLQAVPLPITTKQFLCDTSLFVAVAVQFHAFPCLRPTLLCHASADPFNAIPVRSFSLPLRVRAAPIQAIPLLRFALLILCRSVQNSSTQGGANPLRSSVCRTIIVPKTSEVNCK